MYQLLLVDNWIVKFVLNVNQSSFLQTVGFLGSKHHIFSPGGSVSVTLINKPAGYDYTQPHTEAGPL